MASDDVSLSPAMPHAGAREAATGAVGGGGGGAAAMHAKENEYLFAGRDASNTNLSPKERDRLGLIVTLTRVCIVVGAVMTLIVFLVQMIQNDWIRNSSDKANAARDDLAAVKSQLTSIQQQLTPQGYARADGCRYSDPSVVAISAAAHDFYLNIYSGNQDFAYSSGFWERFTPEFADFESPQNVSLNVAAALQQQIRAALLNPVVLTTEKLSLSQILSDVDLFVNLTRIGLFHTCYSSYVDYAWLADPALLTVDTVDVLVAGAATYTANADFAPKILLWMQNYVAKLNRYTAYLGAAAAAGKTHANVTMAMVFHRYQTALRAGVFMPLCAVVSTVDADSGTACTQQSARIDTAHQQMLQFYTQTYLAACARARPNATPGLSHVPDGSAAYAVWLQYHLGFVTTPAWVYQKGVEQLNATRASSLVVADALLNRTGVTWPEVVAYLGDTTNTRLYFNSPTSAADAIAVTSALRNTINSQLYKEIGYVTRAQTYVAVTGSASTNWQAGGYDTRRRVFTSAARYNIGVHGLDPVTGDQIFERFGAASTCLHEAFPGHGLQVPLAQEVDCAISPFASAPTAFVEGWALYTETFGFSFGLYADAVQHMGHLNANMLRANRLQEDTGLHAYGWSYDSAWQSMAANGFADAYAQTETYRYITMPGQATGYMVGRLALQQYRDAAAAALGTGFSAPEFNAVLTKFGGGTLDDLSRLVDTYVAWKTGQANTQLFGYELITAMFSATLPVVGLGRAT